MSFMEENADMTQPFPIGSEVTHRHRGRCVFQGLDKADPSGATSWVYFIEDDSEEMVSTVFLSLSE